MAQSCPDCETGACVCGSGCEECAYTGECVRCRGLGTIDGTPPPKVSRPPVPRPPAPPKVKPAAPTGNFLPPPDHKIKYCYACHRRFHDAWSDGGDVYKGLTTIDQRIAFNRRHVTTAYRPYCSWCGRTFTSNGRSRSAQRCKAAGALVRPEPPPKLPRLRPGSRTAKSLKSRLRVNPLCEQCFRRFAMPKSRDPLADLTLEQRNERINANPRLQLLPRCSGCARPFRAMHTEAARTALAARAIRLWTPDENGVWVSYVLEPNDELTSRPEHG